MRALPLVAFAIALSLPAAARQPKSTAPVTLSPAPMLAADSEARWVPFELTPGNQIAFRLTINGRAATAVLDTGVNFTLAATAFAGTIGLKPTASGQAAAAIGGSLPIAWAQVESIDFGGLSRHGGRIGVTDLSALSTGTAKPVDVVVGSDLLATHALDIDFDARRFRLLPSGRMPFRGISVPIQTAAQTGTFQVDATVGNARVRPLLIDTGDGSALTLAREAWTTTRLPDTGVTSAYAVGLAGPIETDLVVLPQVRLGTAIARNVEVRIEQKGGYSAATGTAGRIGTGFLQRYRVLLDPRARRMVLVPGKDADRMPLKSTSGLLLSHEGKALRVLHVMRGSPAAAGGWRAGERICVIDGARLSDDYRTSALGQWPAGTPGRTVRLGLCDGGPERALTLAAFY